MEQLVADFVLGMGLILPVAILVAVRAGRLLYLINSINFQSKVTEITIDVIKDKIVEQLSILLRVYIDTHPPEDVHLPTGVNLQEVSARLFFVDNEVNRLHHIYCDLFSQGTQSEYFLSFIQFLGG